MAKKMNKKLGIYSLLLMGFGIFLFGCAALPGEVGLQSVETDRELGLATVKEVDAVMGIYRDPTITNYLNDMGQRLVRTHADQRFEYSFQIVDQVEPNAFAAPGGFVFVSRGLLVLTNNEDELANVMGHEIIHVSRRHTARQMAKQTVPNLLSLPGRVVGSVISQDIGNLINAPINTLGAAFIAKHSREDEFEADRLGQNLSAQAGYDPQALATFLARLEQATQLHTGEQRGPSFFDTHPTTPDRVTRLRRDAQNIEWSRQPGVVSHSAQYLHQLDGLLVGVDPAEGVFQGRKFLQPVLDFSISLPEGWKAMNTRQAVIAVTPEKDAILAVGIIGKGTNPSQAAELSVQAMEKKYRVKPTRSEPVSLDKLPAHLITYSDTSGKEPVHLFFLYVAYRNLIYQFVGLAPERYRATIRETALSFRPLTAEELASIRETRLRIVPARANETILKLSRRTGNIWDDKTTAMVNGIDAHGPLKKGQLIKIAVSKPYRGPRQ